MHLFRKIENGIRVVKAYVREEHEDEKFKKTSGLIYKLFLKAESYLVFNQPINAIYCLWMYYCYFLVWSAYDCCGGNNPVTTWYGAT